MRCAMLAPARPKADPADPGQSGRAHAGDDHEHHRGSESSGRARGETGHLGSDEDAIEHLRSDRRADCENPHFAGAARRSQGFVDRHRSVRVANEVVSTSKIRTLERLGYASPVDCFRLK